MALKISEQAAVQMPMKTVASLIALVAIGTWAYFGVIETQNKLQTQVELMSKDLIEHTDFRIKWPRGQLGSLPAKALGHSIWLYSVLLNFRSYEHN